MKNTYVITLFACKKAIEGHIKIWDDEISKGGYLKEDKYNELVNIKNKLNTIYIKYFKYRFNKKQVQEANAHCNRYGLEFDKKYVLNYTYEEVEVLEKDLPNGIISTWIDFFRLINFICDEVTYKVNNLYISNELLDIKNKSKELEKIIIEMLDI